MRNYGRPVVNLVSIGFLLVGVITVFTIPIVIKKNTDIRSRAQTIVPTDAELVGQCNAANQSSNYIEYPPKRSVAFQQMMEFGCRPNAQGCFTNLPAYALEPNSNIDRYLRYWYGSLPDNGTFSINIPICGYKMNLLGIYASANRESKGNIFLTLTSPSGKVYQGLAASKSPYPNSTFDSNRCIFPMQYNVEPGTWKAQIKVDKAAKDARLDIYLFYNYWRFYTSYPVNDQPLRYNCPPEDMKWLNNG